MGDIQPPLIRPDDLALALGVPLLGLLAWCLPRPWWPHFCARFGPLNRAALGVDLHAAAARIDALRGSRLPGLTARSIVDAVASEDLQATMLVLDSYRPGAEMPAIETPGSDHLRAALAEGQGAVLWVDHTTQGAFGAKAGLAQAGFRASHLSHPRHGFSGSRFGMRWLNPIRTAAEDRHLAERVRISLVSPTGAIRTLRRRLAANGIVSVTARTDAARPLAVPFMDGVLALAPGAPRLAVATGAALLPVHARRDGARLEVRIEAPLATDRLAPEAAAALARGYARRLETAVLEHPGQWLGWLHLQGR